MEEEEDDNDNEEEKDDNNDNEEEKKPPKFINVKFSGPAPGKTQSIIKRLFKMISGEEDNLPETIQFEAR